MFIGLKSLSERNGKPTAKVIDRLRRALADLRGIERALDAVARHSRRRAAGQGPISIYALVADIDELYEWAPKIWSAVSTVPGLADVTSDRQAGGLQLDVNIDRDVASRARGKHRSRHRQALCQRLFAAQFSTIYGDRNQYRVILEVDPKLQREPTNLSRIYVPGPDGAQVPLSSLITMTKALLLSSSITRGRSPPSRFTMIRARQYARQRAQRHRYGAGQDACAALPAGRGSGRRGSLLTAILAEPLLILAALIAIYIVLGVLYESLAHPLTIISTLPSAGLGALIALRAAGMELSMIALIGVILLIGIVKKNGIMLVDFALEGERERRL